MGDVTEFDPYKPRQPKKGAKASAAKPEELPAEVTRSVKGAEEPTVSVRSPDGKETGPVPMSRIKEAMRSGGEGDEFVSAQTVAAGQLRSLIERVERLNEDKQAIADDIKEVFAEAKGVGFDTKAMRAIIRLRKMDEAERQEAEAILDLYKAALGMA